MNLLKKHEFIKQLLSIVKKFANFFLGHRFDLMMIMGFCFYKEKTNKQTYLQVTSKLETSYINIIFHLLGRNSH